MIEKAVLSAVLLGCFVPWVEASTLTLVRSSGSAQASMVFLGTGSPDRSDEEIFGRVAVSQVGRNRAVETGSGLNAVNAKAQLSDIPQFQFHAATSIRHTVENTGTMREQLAFQRLINGGGLRLFSSGAKFDRLEATVAVGILNLARDIGGFL